MKNHSQTLCPGNGKALIWTNRSRLDSTHRKSHQKKWLFALTTHTHTERPLVCEFECGAPESPLTLGTHINDPSTRKNAPSWMEARAICCCCYIIILVWHFNPTECPLTFDWNPFRIRPKQTRISLSPAFTWRVIIIQQPHGSLLFSWSLSKRSPSLGNLRSKARIHHHSRWWNQPITSGTSTCFGFGKVFSLVALTWLRNKCASRAPAWWRCVTNRT